MSVAFENLFHDLQRYIAGHGVRVVLKTMDIDTPGEFDGLTITMNPTHNAEARSYYLAHAFGSIVQWSTDFKAAQKVFQNLRSASRQRVDEPEEFAAALESYQRFEERSSGYAVWMLREIGYQQIVRRYTIFFRADLEAMTHFHRTGQAPRWQEFFPQFKRLAKARELSVRPFAPTPIRRFEPKKIDVQEVLQER